MGENIGPVIPLVPRDSRWRVNFDGHHLAHGSALDQYYCGADPACASAAFFAPLDVCCYQWITGGDVCAWDNVCALNGESEMVTNGKDRNGRERKEGLTADWGHLMDVGRAR